SSEVLRATLPVPRAPASEPGVRALVARWWHLAVPALLGPAQPWRCLCRGFSQMTMTRPCRRITLHLSQIVLTLGLTFIVLPPPPRAPVRAGDGDSSGTPAGAPRWAYL